MLSVYEVGWIVLATLSFLWFHVTMFFTKKPGSIAGLALLLVLIGRAYYELYEANFPLYAYLLVPGVFFMIDLLLFTMFRY